MPGIGEILREARMRHSVDIIEVEGATKIRAKYLRALENEDFDALPGPTETRMFLRTYAQFLGLDGHRLVEEFRSEYDQVEPETHYTPPGAGVERRSGGPSIGPGAIAAVLAFLIIAGLLVLGLTSGEDEPRSTGDRPQTEPRATGPQTVPAAPERRRQSARRATTVRLRIVPTEETYVCVDRGEGTDVEVNGVISQPRTFRGRRLRLNLGKTSARVTVNGERLSIRRGPDAVGYTFTPRRTAPIPDEADRPCN